MRYDIKELEVDGLHHDVASYRLLPTKLAKGNCTYTMYLLNWWGIYTAGSQNWLRGIIEVFLE